MGRHLERLFLLRTLFCRIQIRNRERHSSGKRGSIEGRWLEQKLQRSIWRVCRQVDTRFDRLGLLDVDIVVAVVSIISKERVIERSNNTPSLPISSDNVVDSVRMLYTFVNLIQVSSTPFLRSTPVPRIRLYDLQVEQSDPNHP